ncbi:MAG: hypothetical protein CM15mP85_00450 [Rhodobacterales bacterium]|nr:MAG: hypothetical protein CM15mP85_00450 [Rhodobacterales bacterium]
MYPVADKLPNEIERAAFVEALALIGTDQQDEFYAFCEIGKVTFRLLKNNGVTN